MRVARLEIYVGLVYIYIDSTWANQNLEVGDTGLEI